MAKYGKQLARLHVHRVPHNPESPASAPAAPVASKRPRSPSPLPVDNDRHVRPRIDLELSDKYEMEVAHDETILEDLGAFGTPLLFSSDLVLIFAQYN